MYNRLQYFFCFLFAFIIAKGVTACELTDVECLTKASNWALKAFVPGIKGIVEPSDPLYKEEIIGNLPTFKCHLFNVTLSGMNTCVVTRLTLDPKALKYEYLLRCPQMILNAVGDVKGSLDSVQIEGNGKFYLVIADQQSSKLIEKLFRNPVIDACLNVFVDHLGTFLKAFPVEDLLLKGKSS